MRQSRTAFTQMQDRHQYRELRRAASSVVLIRKTRRWGKTHFRCSVDSTQEDVLRTRRPLLECTFGPVSGSAELRYQGEPLGTLCRHDETYCFRVNGETVLRFGVEKPREGFCTYTVQFEGGDHFDMVEPRWNEDKEQYMLRYRLLRTRRAGVASCKNFQICDADGKSVLECLRLDRRHLLVATKSPFNAFLGAVIGIWRFHC